MITSQWCNTLRCYQQSSVGVYDILGFVYSNMGFIKFSFMSLLPFVWPLAVTGSVLLQQHWDETERVKDGKGEKK